MALARFLVCGFGITLAAAFFAGAAAADTTSARCENYPAGGDQAEATLSCTFSQRQGYIRIRLEDGITHDLAPVEGATGVYTDQQGRNVYRQKGLGDQGLIFRMPDESLYVYWSTNELQAQPADGITAGETGASEEGNPTAPFTTQDYDATTLLRCRTAAATEFSLCPAGVARMENGQASITVIAPDKAQFTINFMSDYINATNREVKANREGDTWTLTFDNGDVWEVPLAAIEGG